MPRTHLQCARQLLRVVSSALEANPDALPRCGTSCTLHQTPARLSKKLDFALTPAVVHPLHQPRILLLVVCSRVRWPPLIERTPPRFHPDAFAAYRYQNPSHVLGNVNLPQPVTSASATCSASPPVIARKQVNFRHIRNSNSHSRDRAAPEHRPSRPACTAASTDGRPSTTRGRRPRGAGLS